MRKSIFLVLLLCGTFSVAQASGPYYVGTSHLDNLLQSIEEPLWDIEGVTLTEFPDMPDMDGDGVEDGAPLDGDWENIGGVLWTQSIKIADYTEDTGLPSGTDYRALKSIDWSDAIYSYTQKSDVDIVWEQPPYEIFETVISGVQADPYLIDGVQVSVLPLAEQWLQSSYPVEDGQVLSLTGVPLNIGHARKILRTILQRHELRFLESLNLAGNQFRSISINGNDLMELSSIDLSNNPTLTFLELKNLPMLATLDVTGCPNVVLNVENCPDVVITGAPTGIVQTPVSNISVWADQGQVFIKGAQNETASVYTIDGRLAKQQKVADGTAGIALDNNLYIVRLSNGTVRKVLVK